MKYIITESRIKDAIVKFLDRYVEPDYGWNKEFHINEVNNFGYADFWVNDELVYSYFVRYQDRNPKTLELTKRLSDQLSSLFGKYWIPIFKEWFEKNSGLEIKQLYFLDKDYNPNIINLTESHEFIRRYNVIQELIDESFDVLRDEVCEHAFSSFLSEVSFQVSSNMSMMDMEDNRDSARVVHKWVRDNFYDYIKERFNELLIEENCSESFDDYLNN